VIEVSGLSQPKSYRGAYYREAAEKLADRVDASVILTGGIRTLDDIIPICEESKVQFFGMARPFMAHPDYLLRMKAVPRHS
jgi:2,4-dienoyl-CoA reductase-like NADH-dependent reductase (Old Yellow Enzyme family)